MRFFNTAGPVNCEKHYCLPPLQRFNLDEILALLAQEKYFVLHAPRQTGKTSALLALRDLLNHEGHYRALYANIEGAQAARSNVEMGITHVVQTLASWARDTLHDDQAERLSREVLASHAPTAALEEFLTLWTHAQPTPTVLFLDEIDALVGDTLISVLRQLRAGYTKRPQHFPSTVILCGVRDVRDYRIHSDQDQAIITGGSAFNVKAESLRLGDFSRTDTFSLLQQHTDETGQPFEAAALELTWELSQGQPWLVNALAYEVTFKMPAGRDRRTPITTEMIQEATERLILRRETHLDQLVDKLREPRVRMVIEPMLEGVDLDQAIAQDHIQYVVDMGLIRRGTEGMVIANPIYREIIPRELTFVSQLNLESTTQPAWYVRPDGRLDMPRLLTAFQQFYREHSEHWLAGMPYREAGPQLLLQAFLQRIVNGGGRVEREYGLGRRRTDLLVIWPHPQGVQRVVIELKVQYKSLAQTIAEGLKQTRAYMDATGTTEGHLVIFDRTPGKSWEEKIFQRAEVENGVAMTVWGM
ncbi:MAG: ATP-binding protein [Anaerolineae bacterium]